MSGKLHRETDLDWRNLAVDADSRDDWWKVMQKNALRSGRGEPGTSLDGTCTVVERPGPGIGEDHEV